METRTKDVIKDLMVAFSDEEHMVEIDLLMQKLNNEGITPQTYGYNTPESFLTYFFQPHGVLSTDKKRFTSTEKSFIKKRQKYLKNYRVDDREWPNFYYINQDKLQELEDLAIPERWTFSSVLKIETKKSILSGYLNSTLYRLHRTPNGIRINGEYACMHTGLCTDIQYKPIFALFKLNKNDSNKWKLEAFSTSTKGEIPRLIRSLFKPLPERAHYISTLDDAVYDFRSPIQQCYYEHILLDHPERIPLKFWEKNLPRNFNGFYNYGMKLHQRKKYFSALATALKNDEKKYNDIVNQMTRAINKALQPISHYDNKIAVPMYNPKQNSISFALPLHLTNGVEPDVALIVSKNENGTYVAHSIFPKTIAYVGARALGPVHSSWLTPDSIDEEVSNFLIPLTNNIQNL